ncbi:hypothetical protein ACIQU5_36230 [Streptomyces sp. NPDC090306]|uniref:hypothetical protein n=1 Tax=Streptomyces sp. NPDC090306 TaxID=3365961 RepID=UPI003810E54A
MVAEVRGDYPNESAALRAVAQKLGIGSAADTDRGRVSQEAAYRMVRKAGFEARERYRGFDVPWTVECVQCGVTLRLRLSDVVLMRTTCPECPMLSEHVREAWAEFVAHGSGELSRSLVRR